MISLQTVSVISMYNIHKIFLLILFIYIKVNNIFLNHEKLPDQEKHLPLREGQTIAHRTQSVYLLPKLK